MSEPLIYTSKGNLPIASLQYQTAWDVQPNYIKFMERYSLDGEVVKESAHIYDTHGALAGAAIGNIGG